ncbi:hypothetical protein [Limosilactobacillus fermentum]|uniref:hypothetical protein n=1 Tax=Limosilactobacillus fermentum TaxID=1613 RepID=UPI00301D6AD8
MAMIAILSRFDHLMYLFIEFNSKMAENGSYEQVNEKELIHWGSSFGVGIEMTRDEAIETLENIGYKIERLEEKENSGE